MTMKKENLPADNTPEKDLETTPAEEERDAAASSAAAVSSSGAGASGEAADAAEGSADAIEPEEDEELAARLADVLGETETPEADAEADSKTKRGKKAKKEKKGVSRKFRYGAMATGLTAVVVVVVVLINVVAGILNDRYPLTTDLSADKIFSLSEESIQVAKSLKDDIDITIFAKEEDLKGSYGQEIDTLYRQLTEGLRQFGVQSGNKIKVEYVDLTGNPQLATEYKEYDVSSGNVFILMRANKGKSNERYQTLSFNDLYTQESDNYGNSTLNSQVEKMLASKLNMVGNNAAVQTLLFTGHGEDQYTASDLKTLLNLNGYVMEEVNPATATAWNEKSQLAVIAAPTKDYTAEEIDKLRLWMDNDGKMGRNLLVLINYAADCPNLYAFLKDEHGIEVTDKLVVETDSNRLLSSSQNSMILGDVASTDFTDEMTDKLTVSVYTRQLITHRDSGEMETTYPIITFPESARLQQMKDADDTSEKTADPVKAESYPIAGMAYAVNKKYDNSGDMPVTRENKVVVCGSMDFVNSTLLSWPSVANEEVFMNVLNGVSGNKDSVQVSAKPLNSEKLQFTANQSNWMGAIFVIIIPVLTLVICLVVFLKRRHL